MHRVAFPEPNGRGLRDVPEAPLALLERSLGLVALSRARQQQRTSGFERAQDLVDLGGAGPNRRDTHAPAECERLGRKASQRHDQALAHRPREQDAHDQHRRRGEPDLLERRPKRRCGIGCRHEYRQGPARIA